MFVSSPNNTGDTAEMPGATRTLFNNEQLQSVGRERSLAHLKAGASLSAAVSISVRRRATESPPARLHYGRALNTQRGHIAIALSPLYGDEILRLHPGLKTILLLASISFTGAHIFLASLAFISTEISTVLPHPETEQGSDSKLVLSNILQSRKALSTVLLAASAEKAIGT